VRLPRLRVLRQLEREENQHAQTALQTRQKAKDYPDERLVI